MEQAKKKILRDATTGKKVEVVVSKSGKLFHIEGFSHSFIKNARRAARSSDSKKNSGQKT